MSSTTDTEQRFAYLLSPEFEIVNTAGKPLTGGWIEVYIHGTRDKYYCLSDFDGTLHPFQIPLDSLGSNIVLASPTHAYDIYIYNKFGSLVMSRYNVVPATNSPDAVADVVVIDSPDETINVTIDGGSNWHLEVNTDLIATASGLAEVSGALTEVSGALLNKKDKQEALSFEGAATKTVKNISQDDNGVITVEYEDIDLPQQVPNVNIISPSGTLDITSTTDPATNTKTFKIDVHKSNMDYFEGYYGRAHYEDRPSDTVAAFTTYVDQWREYRYQGDFIANSWQDQDNTTFLLNSGLYLITASIRYKMTDASVKNKEEYIRIATGAFNGLENGTQLKDWSNEAALDENTIQLSFVRSVDDDEDYDNLRGNHTLYFAPYLPYGVNYAEIDHLQIVKLDSIVTYHGGPGPSYSPGYGIEIQDNVISIATGDVVTNNYFETVVSSINTEINELTTVINNVSGDITNLNESVTNLIGATGDYATKDYVDEAVSGLENYSAGQYISIEDHVINVTGVQPEGDYATNADLQAVSAAIPESEEVEFEELDLAQFAQASAVTVIQNQITNVTGDIYSINEDITNLIGATGDYATEEYVNEAIAAVTGVPFEQQQSDWTQTDDTKVDYIKHKPRQVNLVAGDNITIEQDGFDVIISAEDPGDTYTAGQYISIQNNTIAATGLQPAGNYLTPADLNGYATEQYVDDAVAAVTGQPIAQVNSDWLATSGVAEILNKPDVFQLIAGDNIDITPSGNDLVISASSDVTKAYVDEQIDAATGMIPDISNLATKAELEDVIDMIPDVSNFATNDDVQYVQEQVDQLVAATGYYLQASDLNGYATEQDVDAAIDAATGMIPDVSNLATKSELAAVEAEIPTLPSEEEVEFEELNLSDYALASAIPDISNLATKTELAAVEAEIPDISNLATKAEVQAATGMIPDISDLATKAELSAVEAEIPDISNLATKTELNAVDAKVDAVSAEIPTLPEEEEVQFEEVNLSDYALASAIPSLDGYATEQYVDEQIAAVTGIIPSDVVTEQELADAIVAATGLIPDVSNLATKSELEDYIPYAASGVDLPNSKFGITPDGQAYKTIQHNVKRDVVYSHGDMLLQTDIEGTYYPAGTYEIHVPVGATYAHVVLDQETYILDVNNGVALWTVSTPFTTAGVDYVIVALDSDTNTIALTADNSALYLAGQDSIVNYLTETDLIAGANVTITDVGSGIMISASGGGAEDDEFYAIYGVTTLAEVNAAAAAGKKLFAKSGDMILLCDNRSSTYATFIAVDYNAGPEIITATVTSSGWAISTDSLQANWAETDTSKASYIYNKPAIPNYTAGSGIDITNDVISVDDTVITTEASGVYLPNSNFEIAPDGRAAIVKGGAGSTDYTPAWVDGTYNVLTFAEPITLLAGDTISFNHSKYPYVFIRINGITVVNEYIPGSQYTYTVESDTQVSEISIAASDDDPRFIRLNTVTITSSAVQRDVYVLKSELASAVEHIESEIVTPVQSDWNVTASGNLAYIKNKPGNERFVPEASFEIIGQVLTVGNGGIPFWAQPQGSYSAGKGITLANNAISVDDTVITTAATAVNLSKANFEIDNNGQAYKLSNNSTQVTYAITQDSNGGTFDGTIKLNAGDTITITNCPVTDEQLDVRLMSNNTNVAGYNGAVTAGSNIVLTVTRDTDLTDTFKVQVFSFTSFDNVPLTNSSCTFNNIVTSREEYALESDVTNYIAGQNITFTASGDDVVISAQGGGVQVNADWNATSGVAEILNKPTEKNLIAGANVTITESNDEVTIETTEIASGLQLVAGAGITLTVSGNTIVAGLDETVLYTASSAADSITTTEEVTNFERLRIELQSAQSTYVKNCLECKPDANNLVYTGTALIPAATYPLQLAGVRYTSSNGKNFTFSSATRMCYKVNGTYGDASTTTLANSDIKDVGFITKIVGINRISN